MENNNIENNNIENNNIENNNMENNNITITVSQTGKGDYCTIQEALNAVQQKEHIPVTITVEKGIYKEKLIIKHPKLTLIGKEVKETIITYDDYAQYIMEDGNKRGTFRTPTVFIDTNHFTAKNLTFQNVAGPGTKVGQALALYVDGTGITFENCNILGGQDTLFTAPLPPLAYEPNGFKGPKEFEPRIKGTHYYKNCFISGDVDFIFGGATAYFEGCELFSNDVKKEINGYVTAASTPEGEQGYVFNNCKFTSNCPPRSVYLGRPWRNFAKVVILNSEIGEHIKEEGWDDWGKTNAHETIFFAEYNNTGKGAATDKRMPWIKILNAAQAKQYSRDKILGF